VEIRRNADRRRASSYRRQSLAASQLSLHRNTCRGKSPIQLASRPRRKPARREQPLASPAEDRLTWWPPFSRFDCDTDRLLRSSMNLVIFRSGRHAHRFEPRSGQSVNATRAILASRRIVK